MRMSDWSSDVCSSDLLQRVPGRAEDVRRHAARPVLSRAFPAARNARSGHAHGAAGWGTTRVFAGADRKGVGWGKRASERVDLGGGRIMTYKITLVSTQIYPPHNMPRPGTRKQK